MRRRAVLVVLAALAAALLALPAGAWAAADTTPPSLAFTGDLFTSQITNAATPQAEFTVSDASGLSSVQCKVDSGTYADCTSPYSMPGLAEGPHTVTVRAVDASPLQNSNTQSFDFIVDRTPPTLDLPASGTANDVATWGYSDANGPVTATCSLTGSGSNIVPGPCSTSSSLIVSGVPDGTYTLAVTLEDAAGNVTDPPGEETLTISHTAPTVSITAGPTGSNVTGDPTPAFTFSTTGGVTTKQCAVDGGTPVDCSSGSFTPASALADGPHVFEVQVSDGSQSATAFASFVVDTTPPTITFLVPDGSYVNGAIGFEAFDASTPSLAFECDIGDGNGFQPCGTTIDLSPLGDGPHTITVQTTDAAGNVRDQTIHIVIDRSTPTITPGTITVAPGTATVTFSAADATSPVTVNCRLDGGPYGACTTAGSDTVSGLAAGVHSIDVLVVDAAGNRNVFTATFTVPAPTQADGGTSGGGGGTTTTTTGSGASGLKLSAKLHRHGRRAPSLTLRCNERCTVKLRFTRKGRTLGTRTVKLTAGRSATITLRLSKGFGRAHSLKVLLRATATDGAGHTSTRSLSVTLYRR